MNTERPDPSTEIITSALTNQIAQKTKLHLNLDQDAILTTEDKVRLVLLTHLQRLEKRKSWIAPVGIFITVLTSFVTTNFKDFGLKAATWEAIFLIAGVVSFVWLVIAFIQAIKAPSLDDVVSELKKSGKQKSYTNERG
jgi:hypothetical protein